MAERLGEHRRMPNIPNPNFIDSLCEIWFQISYAAYHLAYVKVYSQSAGLQTDMQILRGQEQELRENAQVDLIICRTHLAAFFWQLEHLFESLRIAIKRGKSEDLETQYFWTFEKVFDEIEQDSIRKEIKDYRNMSQQIPAIIGVSCESPSKFHHLFLPTINGHVPREDVDLVTRLQEYFEFAAKVWLSFAPSDLQEKFPRDFTFPVTVPNLFLGELPANLSAVPQLQVTVQHYYK